MHYKSLIVYLTLFFLFYTPLNAQVKIPSRPKYYTPVNDFAQVLASEEAFYLTQKLKAYEDTTSTQIVIVLLESLEGEKIEVYAKKLAKSWGIGQKNKNNGVLILAAIQDRKIRIQVGYGLEKSITKDEAALIIDEKIKPDFRKEAYFEGLKVAIEAIFIAAEGEFIRSSHFLGVHPFFLWITIILLICFIILYIKITSFRQQSAKVKHRQNQLKKTLSLHTLYRSQSFYDWSYPSSYKKNKHYQYSWDWLVATFGESAQLKKEDLLRKIDQVSFLLQGNKALHAIALQIYKFQSHPEEVLDLTKKGYAQISSEIQSFFKDKNYWTNVLVIRFQDKSANQKLEALKSTLKEIESKSKTERDTALIKFYFDEIKYLKKYPKETFDTYGKVLNDSEKLAGNNDFWDNYEGINQKKTRLSFKTIESLRDYIRQELKRIKKLDRKNGHDELLTFYQTIIYPVQKNKNLFLVYKKHKRSSSSKALNNLFKSSKKSKSGGKKSGYNTNDSDYSRKRSRNNSNNNSNWGGGDFGDGGASGDW